MILSLKDIFLSRERFFFFFPLFVLIPVYWIKTKQNKNQKTLGDAYFREAPSEI